jgi:hypothetical protein
MRKGFLGSLAALAAGAGSVWGQMPVAPVDPPPPAAISKATTDPHVIPANGSLLPPGLQQGPAPVIMPPVAFGPAGDPQGLGPVGGFGPPPSPMYPMPGAYGAQQWQPAAGAMGPGSPGSAPHVWTSVEYLLWFAQAQPIRFPLVTTSAPSDFGLLGRPSTLVLVGQNDLGYNSLSGFRVTTGFFGDADRRHGFEASGFMTEQKSNASEFVSSPAGIPTLARPFLDTANPRAAASLVIANPNFANGRVSVDTHTASFGIEANGVWNLFRSEPGCSKGCSVDFLAGYRFYQLKEDLGIESVTSMNSFTTTPNFIIGPFGVPVLQGVTIVPNSVSFGGILVTTPSNITVRDNILCYNNFNGGQVGLRGEVHHGMWVINTTGKFAIGSMHQRIEITGASGFSNANTNRFGSNYGGLYATSSNIAVYNIDEFAVMPEFNTNVGLYITRGLSVSLGYNFLYANKVARPGSQINPIVDTSTVPFSPNYGATNRPAAVRLPIQQDDFWLMGINFSLRLQY